MLRIFGGFSGFRGRSRAGLLLLGFALLFPPACGESEEGKPQTTPEAGRGGRGGFGGASGAGAARGGSAGDSNGGTGDTGGTSGAGGEPTVDPRAPVVTILSPEELSEPGDGAVLVDTEVEVVCEARQSSEPGSEPIDESKLLLKMIDADGEVVDEKTGVETRTPGEFSAPFILTDIPNGPVTFRCEVPDTSLEALVGSDENSTFVDHGPAIEVSEPEDGSAHSAQGEVAFSFTVTPDPLTDDDPDAEIEDVTLRVLDQEISLTEDDGIYTATVDFTDTGLFPDPATNVEATITARNVRMPVRGVNEYTWHFVLDSVGPEIDITAPGDEEVVGGEVRLVFTITDEHSSVDEDTVSVRINNLAPVFYGTSGRWSRDGDEFVYIFNSTIIDGNTAQTTINVDARDVAGNRSLGNPHLIYVDNTPPIVDLDPPLIRERNDGSTPEYCSVAFDAVGEGSANDLETVLRAKMIRAVVWSLGNGVPGQTVFFQAATKQDSVFLYVLEDPSPTRFLLEDTNGDGVCDDIKDKDVPNALGRVDLFPIEKAGEAWFGSMANDPMNSPSIPTNCEYQNTLNPPDRLCTNRSDLRRAISHHLDREPPVIYALGNSHGGTGAACAGIDWEIANNVSADYEGWICVAARAEDVFANGTTGNHGVSRPLRLCYDNGEGDPPDCSGLPPSCIASNCTLPPAFFQNFIYDPL